MTFEAPFYNKKASGCYYFIRFCSIKTKSPLNKKGHLLKGDLSLQNNFNQQQFSKGLMNMMIHSTIEAHIISKQLVYNSIPLHVALYSLQKLPTISH